MIAPSVSQAHDEMVGYERVLGLRGSDGKLRKRPTHSDMSHERSDYRDDFRKFHGEFFNSMQTDYEVGLPQIKRWLDVIDKTQSCPLQPELMGRCRLQFIAPDGEYQLAFNERQAKYFVTSSKTERGYKRMRAEFTAYHYPISERGKPPKKMRPAAIFDDIMSCIKGSALRQGPTLGQGTKEEQAENALPEALQKKAIVEASDDQERERILLARQVALREQKIEHEERKNTTNPYLSSIRRVSLQRNRRQS
jgi:hypothetical protein